MTCPNTQEKLKALAVVVEVILGVLMAFQIINFVSFTFSVFVAKADGIPAGWNWEDQIQ